MLATTAARGSRLLASSLPSAEALRLGPQPGPLGETGAAHREELELPTSSVGGPGPTARLAPPPGHSLRPAGPRASSPTCDSCGSLAVQNMFSPACCEASALSTVSRGPATSLTQLNAESVRHGRLPCSSTWPNPASPAPAQSWPPLQRREKEKGEPSGGTDNLIHRRHIP